MQPPQASRVNVVIDALVTLFSDIDNVSVLDGPTPETLTQQDIIGVGIGNQAAAVTVERERGLALNYVETAEIYCAVSSWDGSTELKALRDRCTDLLGQIRLLLPSLKVDGLCDLPLLGGRMGWQQANTSDGGTVSVTFTVRVKTTI